MLFGVRLMTVGLVWFGLQLVSHCLGYKYFFVVCYVGLSIIYFVFISTCSVLACVQTGEPTCRFWLNKSVILVIIRCLVLSAQKCVGAGGLWQQDATIWRPRTG